jgi:dTDP-4-dehydrorhamnose 3,5-epimerase
MQIEDTDLDGVKVITLDVFGDERGAFAESFDTVKFAELGIDVTFVQDSWSYSTASGTVRGFHFQLPPRAQHKLVRVTRGRVFDVIVDLRQGSDTFAQHISIELDATDMKSVFVPAGFAHGFCSLTDDAEITYKMSDNFSPDHYRGLLWNDPALGINWPIDPGDAIVSAKDSSHPTLKNLPQVF